jgi:hypothetical protein
VVLKLNGKPLQLHPPTPTEVKIKGFLDKAPTDELYSSTELAKKAGVARSMVCDTGNRDQFKGYSARLGQIRYWGNPKAIIELLKQVTK